MGNDADKSLDILIKTKADLDGTTKATKGLEEVKAATGETAKKSEFLGLKFGELKKLTRELAHEFPLAGDAARLMLNPIAATFTIAIGLFAKAKEKLDEWNKSLDESAAELAKGTWMEAIVARKRALEEGAEASARYTDRLAHLVDQEARFEAAVANSIAAIHAKNQAEGEIADANYGFNVEKLKHDLAAGLVSQAHYFAQLGALEKQHETEKAAREHQAHVDEIATLKGAVEAASGRLPGQKSAATSAREASTKAQAKLDFDTEQRTALDTEKKGADKAFEEAEAFINKYGGVNTFSSQARTDNPEPTQRKWAQEHLDVLEKAQGRQKAVSDKLAALAGALPGEKTAASAAEREAGRREDTVEKTSRYITDTQDQIETKTREFKDTDEVNSRLAKTRNDTTDLRTREELDKSHFGGFTGADVERFAHDEMQKRNFQFGRAPALSKQENEWVGHFENFANTSGANMDKLLPVAFKLAATANSQAQKLAALESLVDALLRSHDVLRSMMGGGS